MWGGSRAGIASDLGMQSSAETRMTIPQFTAEDDEVGLGWCVIATWPDGRREVVTGFGDEYQARRWIEVDSARWLESIRREASRPE